MLKRTGKIIGVLLGLCLLISAMAVIGFSATCTTCTYSNGFCTVCDSYQPAVLNGDVYEISNAGQLYWFAAQVNGGNTAINGKLMADIVINESVLNADGTLNGDGSNFRVWTPIGNTDFKYYGTFDGNGKTVSGLYFNDTSVNYVGLFGYLDSDGKVRNVGVIDSYFKGYKYVGGVVGYNKGNVSNCYNTGSVSGNDYFVGGVGGQNYYGTTSNCYNTGRVRGISFVGGVVGDNSYGTVSNCYYLSGCARDGYFSVQYGIGTYKQGSNEADKAGKTVGKTTGQFASGEVAYLLGDAFGQTIGTDEYPILGGTQVQYTNGVYFNNSVPTLKDGYYEIYTADQLYWFATQVNGGSTSINGKLMADIVINENILNADGTLNGDGSNFRVWTTIGYFDNYVGGVKYNGTFDGNGKTISGLYFNDTSKDYVGVFGCVDSDGKVQNVGVVDCYFAATIMSVAW